MRIADIDVPEFGKLILERVNALIKNGEAVFETAYVTRSGRIIPIEVSSKIIEMVDRSGNCSCSISAQLEPGQGINDFQESP